MFNAFLSTSVTKGLHEASSPILEAQEASHSAQGAWTAMLHRTEDNSSFAPSPSSSVVTRRRRSPSSVEQDEEAITRAQHRHDETANASSFGRPVAEEHEANYQGSMLVSPFGLHRGESAALNQRKRKEQHVIRIMAKFMEAADRQQAKENRAEYLRQKRNAQVDSELTHLMFDPLSRPNNNNNNSQEHNGSGSTIHWKDRKRGRDEIPTTSVSTAALPPEDDACDEEHQPRSNNNDVPWQQLSLVGADNNVVLSKSDLAPSSLSSRSALRGEDNRSDMRSIAKQERRQRQGFQRRVNRVHGASRGESSSFVDAAMLQMLAEDEDEATRRGSLQPKTRNALARRFPHRLVFVFDTNVLVDQWCVCDVLEVLLSVDNAVFIPRTVLSELDFMIKAGRPGHSNHNNIDPTSKQKLLAQRAMRVRDWLMLKLLEQDDGGGSLPKQTGPALETRLPFEFGMVHLTIDATYEGCRGALTVERNNDDRILSAVKHVQNAWHEWSRRSALEHAKIEKTAGSHDDTEEGSVVCTRAAPTAMNHTTEVGRKNETSKPPVASLCAAPAVMLVTNDTVLQLKCGAENIIAFDWRRFVSWS